MATRYNDPYTSDQGGYQSSYPQYGYPNPYPGGSSSEVKQEPQADSYYSPYEEQKPADSRRYDGEQDDRDYTYGAYDTTNFNYPPAQRQATQRTVKSTREVASVRSGFDQGEFSSAPKRRTTKDLKAYRYLHRGDLWAKGGRGRTAFRFCFCTLMTVIILFVSVVLSLALWIRPPDIDIGDVKLVSGDTGSPIQQLDDGVSFNIAVPISVKNPNYFTVDLSEIKAVITYPVNGTNNADLGGGVARNIKLKSKSQSEFDFPISIVYKQSQDIGSRVVNDLAIKCGALPGTTKSNLIVDYKITVGIRFLVISISPKISNKFSFPCPLSASDLSKWLGNLTP